MATINQVGVGLAGSTGSGAFAGSNVPTFTSPVLGAALLTSINFGGTGWTQYVNGSWTPTLTFATPGNLSVSYSIQKGVYILEGNQLTIICQVTFTPTFTTASGMGIIQGTPFAPTSGSNPGGVMAISGITFPVSYTYCGVGLSAGSTNIQMNMFGSSQPVTTLTTTQLTTATPITLLFSMTYIV
jgi:hypothetical protein